MEDPAQFIESRKRGIMENASQSNCTSKSIVKRLKSTISTLSAIQRDKLATITEVKRSIERTSIDCRSVFEDWLLKALWQNVSYGYAFNYLAQRYNREETSQHLRIELIEENRIEALLLKDESQDTLKGFDFSIPGRKPHEKLVLDKVFNLLSQKKIISGSKDDFPAMFGQGETVNAPMVWLYPSPNKKTGNQEALGNFLNIMFNGLPNEVVRKAHYLFIDQHGKKFFRSTFKIRIKGFIDYQIEKDLKDILTNTRPNSTA